MKPDPVNISRRSFARQLGVSALGALVLPGCSQAPERRHRPVNILMINADDLGMGDLSCYGGEIPTPRIDSLERDGVRFTDFYVTAPVCTPSRFSQLTGLVPLRSAHRLLTPLMPTSEADRGRGLEPGETTIAEVLKERGYATGLVGKWHLGHGDRRFLPGSHGFDYFYGFLPGCFDYFTHRYQGEACFFRNEVAIEEEGYSTDLFTREAVDFIQRNRSVPFYLNLAYNAPHYGKADAPGAESNVLQAPEDLAARFTGPDRDRNIYSAMVSSMDDGVGRVLEALDSLGLAEKTLVVFTSDNGADPDYGGCNGPFRGEKGTLFEGGIRIPCLIRLPGLIPAGISSSQVGSHLDFFATFASLTGEPVNKLRTDGMDLAQTLSHPESRPVERTLFWVYGKTQVIREGSWKYMSSAGGGQYLFELGADPYEKNNLLGAEPERAAILKARLDELTAGML